MEEEYDDDREDAEEMELEELDGDTEESDLTQEEEEEGEEENPMPPAFLQNIGEKLENFRGETTDKAKQKGDEWFDKAMNTATRFYGGHKELLFSAYDKVMDLKDNLKAAYKKKFKKKSAETAPKEMLETKTGAVAAAKKEPKTKFGQWLAARKAKKAEKKAKKESEPKKPGKFSKVWGNIKSGASKLIQKAADTETGRWVQQEIKKGKEWLEEQKPWLDEKKQKLLEFKNRISDELDDHEHERRMALKARNGDADYENRYNQYVQELSQNEDIQALLRKMSPEEIATALNELDNNVGEENKKDEPGSKAATVGKALNMLGEKAGSESNQKKLGEWISPTGASVLTGALHGGGALAGAVSGIQSARAFGKREQAMKELHKEVGSDRKLGHLVSSQQELARRNKIAGGFDAAKSITTGAKNILNNVPGAKVYSKVASVAGFGVDLAKKGVISSMESKSVKSTLKELLGGPEGYRKLKDKYRLQAQEMKRGIRESLGVRELKDVADMEQANLVDYAQEQAETGNSQAQRTLSGIGDEAVRDIRKNAVTARKNRKTYRQTARAM